MAAKANQIPGITLFLDEQIKFCCNDEGPIFHHSVWI